MLEVSKVLLLMVLLVLLMAVPGRQVVRVVVVLPGHLVVLVQWLHQGRVLPLQQQLLL